MRTQLTAALAAAAITSGCGLTGPEPAEPSQRSGQITVGEKSRQTQLVKCTQNQWALSIDATTDRGRARAYLQLGGVEPVVRTVSLENIDGLNGIAGGDVGTAEACNRRQHRLQNHRHRRRLRFGQQPGNDHRNAVLHRSALLSR